MSIRFISVSVALCAVFAAAVTFSSASVAWAGSIDGAAAVVTATPDASPPPVAQTLTVQPLTSALAGVPSAPQAQEPAKAVPLAPAPAIIPAQPAN